MLSRIHTSNISFNAITSVGTEVYSYALQVPARVNPLAGSGTR